MRNRSMALVTRGDKILLVRLFSEGREFYSLPGGGIEPGETPGQAALRELKEECGVDGTLLRPLNTLNLPDGSQEHVFLVAVPPEQEARTGSDPETPPDEQIIREACWRRLCELSEKDRAFLFSYGLLNVEGYFDLVISWGDRISWPLDESRRFPNDDGGIHV